MKPPPRPRNLLDPLREALQTKHYARRTEQACVDGVKRFTLRMFHHRRHPKDKGRADIEAFLTHLTVERQVAASTQNQALSALRCAS